ncbi:adenylosuccinate lyase [compost metagenome]
MKEGATTNDLLARLEQDEDFGLSSGQIANATDPSQFTGRAPEQVDEFLSEVVHPLLAGTPSNLPEDSEIRV